MSVLENAKYTWKSLSAEDVKSILTACQSDVEPVVLQRSSFELILEIGLVV